MPFEKTECNPKTGACRIQGSCRHTRMLVVRAYISEHQKRGVTHLKVKIMHLIKPVRETGNLVKAVD